MLTGEKCDVFQSEGQFMNYLLFLVLIIFKANFLIILLQSFSSENEYK